VTTVLEGSNTERVRALLRALAQGDDETVLELVDPAIELVPLVVRAGLVPEPYRGINGLRAYLEDTEAAEIERGFVMGRLRAIRETVVVFGHLCQDGTVARTPAIWVWRLRDGLATHGAVVGDESTLRGKGRGGSGSAAALRPIARPALWLELPAVAESVGQARHAVRIWADNLALTARERTAIMLAVSEAATNAVQHAYPRGAGHESFRVRADVDGGRLLVTVEDDGIGLDTRSTDPGLGLGLPLLGQLASAVRLVGRPERESGSEVRMWFALDSLTRCPDPRAGT
jgi:anti-sigma regulatory factor (Ser/Thr protein kinase)/ketosteroid isomerase-like protein